LLIRPTWRLLVVQLPARWLVGFLSVAALAGCALLFRDYRNLDRLMFLVIQKVDNQIASSPQVDALLAGADAGVLIYRPQAEHMLGIAMPLTADGLAGKIASTDRLLARAPTPETVARRAVLAVLAGDLEAARWHLRRLEMFYPRQSRELVEQMYSMAEQRPADLAALGHLLVQTTPAAPVQEPITPAPDSTLREGRRTSQ